MLRELIRIHSWTKYVTLTAETLLRTATSNGNNKNVASKNYCFTHIIRSSFISSIRKSYITKFRRSTCVRSHIWHPTATFVYHATWISGMFLDSLSLSYLTAVIKLYQSSLISAMKTFQELFFLKRNKISEIWTNMPQYFSCLLNYHHHYHDFIMTFV